MPREHIVKIRLSAAEHERLEELAEAWRIRTKAGMLRALLRGAGPPEQPIVPGDSLDMVLAEIAEFDARKLGPRYAGFVRQQGELREGQHEPIIEWERFAAAAGEARAPRSRQAAPAARRPALARRSDYLLRGLLTCARCGHGLYMRDYSGSAAPTSAAPCARQRGTCDLPILDADLIEKPTLATPARRLRHRPPRAWIEERLAERDQDLARGSRRGWIAERADLAERERKVAKAKTERRGPDRGPARPRNGCARGTRCPRGPSRRAGRAACARSRARSPSTVGRSHSDRGAAPLRGASRAGRGRTQVDAKDTTALNTALRSLLSDATVDWIEGLGVEVFFTLAGDGPGLLAFAVGGRPDRIRREDHYSLSERSGIFAEKPERTPSSTGDSAHPCRSRRLRSLSKFDRQGAQEGQQTRRVNKQVRGAALGH